MPSNTKSKTLTGILVVLFLCGVVRIAIIEVKQDSSKTATLVVSPKKQSKINVISAQKVNVTPEEQAHAWRDFMAGRSFVLVINGRPERFTLSLSELYVSNAAPHNRLRTIEAQNDVNHLMMAAKDLGVETTGLVLYPEGQEKHSQSRQILHKKILIQTSDRQRTLASLKAHNLKLLSEPEYSPGSLIVEPLQGGPEATLKALEQLSGDSSVTSAGPLLLHQLQKHSTPNDTLFPSQWHLKNTGQVNGTLGVDMNVTSVWDTYRGQGIKIAIVDDGLQILHPDLAPNADTTNHYDWNDFPNDTNPAPSQANNVEDYHGTSVGGVAAARGNNTIGVSGVAPEATLVGFRLISDLTSDDEDADAMSRGKDVIHIKNNSWSFGGFAWTLSGPSSLMEDARRDATETGRNGKGTIFVWSAGNGRASGHQGQKDGATNSMYVTTVGATTNNGLLTSYSETGSHLVVCAPSSGGTQDIYTTDLIGNRGYNETGIAQGEVSNLDYTNDFGGTSSSAPAVSGAVALMLEANPNLNWRDVKEILLRTSTPITPQDLGWVIRDGGYSNLPPIRHHQSYGGGQINVQAAVSLAETWTSLGPMLQISRTSTAVAAIPDNSARGINVVFDFSTANPMRVEHAKLRLNVSHGYRGDLEIRLTSPSGTISTLATKEVEDDGANYFDWNFSSVRHWGESVKGKWTLNIRDIDPISTGTFNSATLNLYGTDFTPISITSLPNEPKLLAAGEPLTLNLTAAGNGTFMYSWLLNLKQTATTQILQIPEIALSQAGRYQAKASNLTGSINTDSVYLQPVRVSLINGY
ncbi:MAG: S8 family serine peptidase [Verrucomicrobia bacterium]|nr:S8 family serine peptidase [Verrucomicrobiota bacterium]